MGRRPNQDNPETPQQLESVVVVDESVKQLESVVIIGLVSKYLKEGAEYTVTGDTAYRLISKGVAKLKA